jgi:hypothetical protein
MPLPVGDHNPLVLGREPADADKRRTESDVPYLFVDVHELGGLDQAIDAVAVCPTPEAAHLA